MGQGDVIAKSAGPRGLDYTPGRHGGFTVGEFFVGLFFLLVVWFAGRILLMAFGGVLIAVFLNTLAKRLSSIMFIPYGWSLAVVVSLILALVGTVFFSVGNLLASQANEFSEAVPRSLKQIEDYLSQYQWGQWILEQSPEWGRSLAQGNLPSRITDVASSSIEFIAALVIMIFIGLYCAAEPEMYANGLVRLVPLDRRERAREVYTAIVYNLRWWIMGQLFAMACVGVITGVGMWIVGSPLVMTLALLAAMLEIIPNIGPLLWLVPAVLVSLTQGSQQVMNIVIVYGVTHMMESYVIIPIVQRRTVWLPPALSILAVVLLGLLAGFLGLLVAAPIALVTMLLVKMLYVEDRLGDQSLEVPGEAKR